VSSASDRRKLWLGLRAMAHDQSYTQDLSTFNITNLRAMRSAMGKYGVRPGDLAWITSISGFLADLIDLPEVRTVDKYGVNATILTGELAKLDGIPVIISEWARENLNAAGVYDGVTTNKTTLSLVNRNAFVMGERRKGSVQLLKELYAESDQDALIVRERVTFDPLFPIDSNESLQLGYNF